MKHDAIEFGPASTGEIAVRSLASEAGHIREQWDSFVYASPASTFFHRAGWQRILERVFDLPTMYLYAERGDRIEGVLPLAQLRSVLFGNALISLPFAVYGGVVADTQEAAAALETRALEEAQRLGVDYLELRHIGARHVDWPKQDLYVRFRKAIDPDPEVNLAAIPRKQRAMVRKGMKHGLASVVDADIDRFYRLYADNVHRHGTPGQGRRYFAALADEFGPDCGVLTVTDAQGVAVSSVLSFYFRGEVLPYYAGDDVRARDLAANDFKYWELLRRACERGLTTFDYGRSKRDSGSYSFKKNWGFEPEPLHYEFRLYRGERIPENNPNNPRYRALIAAWRRMPLGLANLIGPRIARYLG